MIEVAHNVHEKQHRQVRYRIGEGVTGKVMQTAKPMVIPKVSEDPLFLDRFKRTSADKEKISFICVPISIGTDVIGTVSLDR